jgi:hypothetical protein
VSQKLVLLQKRIQNLCHDRVSGRKTVPEFLHGIACNIRLSRHTAAPAVFISLFSWKCLTLQQGLQCVCLSGYYKRCHAGILEQSFYRTLGHDIDSGFSSEEALISVTLPWRVEFRRCLVAQL